MTLIKKLQVTNLQLNLRTFCWAIGAKFLSSGKVLNDMQYFLKYFAVALSNLFNTILYVIALNSNEHVTVNSKNNVTIVKLNFILLFLKQT